MQYGVSRWDAADKGFDLTGTVTETSNSRFSHEEQLSQSSEDLMRMDDGRKVGAVQFQASSLEEFSRTSNSQLSVTHGVGRQFSIDTAASEVQANYRWTDKQISSRSEYREYAAPTAAPTTTMATLRTNSPNSTQSLLGTAPTGSTLVQESNHSTFYASPLSDVTKTVQHWIAAYESDGSPDAAPILYRYLEQASVNVSAWVEKIGYVFNGSSTLRSKSTFTESDQGTIETYRGLERQEPNSFNNWTVTYAPVQSHTGGITQTITHSKPAADNSITLPGQGTHSTAAPGGEHHAGTSTLATYLTVQQPLAEFVGQFSTKTGYVSLSAAGESASSGEYHSQTGGGNAGNNQNTSNPTETLDDDWLLPDEANRRRDSGLLDLTPESAFEMMVSDPMFRAMLEQFLRNRATWQDPDVMSDKSIWDSCMQLYWKVKFHQTLSAAEKAKFESSLNGATEDKRTPLCDHWVFWFAPESVRLFVLAPEAAAEIAQQRSARAALVGKLASADSKTHYRALMDTYRSGKYTNEMLNSTAGVYGEHFLAVLGVPLKGTQLAKEAVENVGGLASGVNKVDNAAMGLDGLRDSMMSLMRKIPSRALTTAEKAEFKSFMNDFGVFVEFGKKADDGSDIMRFMPVGPGRAQLNLPENATWYQALHESGHFYDWICRGKPSRAVWLDIPYHIREKSVFDWIKTNYWDDLTPEQQSDAWLQYYQEYIDFLRTGRKK